MSNRVNCRKGDACLFTVTVTDGTPSKYTLARFQVRESFDDTLPPLIEADESDGITIDHGDGTIEVVIGASKTEALTATGRAREVAAMLRLYDPLDVDDRVSYVIPFAILPDAIDDT
jgi:hypothetical protein